MKRLPLNHLGVVCSVATAGGVDTASAAAKEPSVPVAGEQIMPSPVPDCSAGNEGRFVRLTWEGIAASVAPDQDPDLHTQTAHFAPALPAT